MPFFKGKKDRNKNAISDEERQINTLQKQNEILKKFIMISMEADSISTSCSKMIKILKYKYQINYCTLLLSSNLHSSTENGFDIVYSDCDRDTQISLKKFVIENLPQIIDVKIFMSDGEHTLSYTTADERDIKYASIMKLKTKKELIGILIIEKTTTFNAKMLEEESFKTIIETLTISIENLLLHEKIRNMAIKDQLTGSFNRRYLYDEYLRSINNDLYSVAMIDIDFFKKINDTYSHAGGDKVLKAVSSCLVNSLGPHGIVFRFGGEEFLVHIPGRDKAAAYELLEKSRIEIENLVINYTNNQIRINISAGIADTTDANNFDTIKNLADLALYKAKETGRNRVIVYIQ